MTEQSETPPHVLLWSMLGSGEHYHGPATYSFRMYSMRKANELNISLAHGLENQAQYDLFQEQYFICRGDYSAIPRARFTRQGTLWMREHARQFDLVHTLGGYHSAVRPCCEATKLGIPVVLFVIVAKGGLADPRGWKRILGLAAKRRKMASEFAAIIALSQEIKAELLSYGFDERRIVQIPNFADVEKFFPVPQREKQAIREQLGLADLPTIVFSGRICRRKQPHLLVEVLSCLAKRGVDAQLVMVGPDGERDYVDRIDHLIGEFNLSQRVIKTGFRTDVEKWLQASDIYSLPSLIEGMPGSLIEALSCGLPAIVTPFSGAADVIINDNYGRIVSSQVEEMADAFEEYLSDPGLLATRGAACRALVVDRFSAQAVYELHLGLFRRILQGKDPAG